MMSSVGKREKNLRLGGRGDGEHHRMGGDVRRKAVAAGTDVDTVVKYLM